MDLLGESALTPLQALHDEMLKKAGVQFFVKRDDLIHPEVSGNKWRKLKYNLLDAAAQKAACIVTFGGAYSNHLYATAAAGNALGIKTVGIVRGEDAALHESPTLQFCRSRQMELHFVSRQEYRSRSEPEYLAKLADRFDNPYIIPEGGTTALALPGMQEMVGEVKAQLGKAPDYYCVAAGTGGTAAGILSAGEQVVAFPVLKGGGFLKDDIAKLLPGYPDAGKLDLQTEYHFGGYAKWNAELLGFIDDFNKRFGIQLEQVYTGKMFFGIFDLIQKGYFPKGTLIVAVHTGGLQGLLRR